MEDALDLAMFDVVGGERRMKESNFLDKIAAYSETLLSNTVERRKLMESTKPYSRWSPGTAAMARAARRDSVEKPRLRLNLDGEYSPPSPPRKHSLRDSSNPHVLKPRYTDNTVLEEELNSDVEYDFPVGHHEDGGGDGGSSTDSFLDNLDMEQVERKIKQLKAKLRQEKEMKNSRRRAMTSPNDSISISSFSSTSSSNSFDQGNAQVLWKEKRSSRSMSTDPMTQTSHRPFSKTSGRKESDCRTSGRKSSEYKTSGRKSSDYKTSGRKASEYKTSGRKASDYKTSGRKASDYKTSGRNVSDAKFLQKKASEKRNRIMKDSVSSRISKGTSRLESAEVSSTRSQQSRKSQSKSKRPTNYHNRGALQDEAKAVSRLSSRMELLSRPKPGRASKLSVEPTKIQKSVRRQQDVSSKQTPKKKRLAPSSSRVESREVKERASTSVVQSGLRERLRMAQKALGEQRNKNARLLQEQQEAKKRLSATTARLKVLNNKVRQLEARHRSDVAELRRAKESAAAVEQQLERSKRRCSKLNSRLSRMTDLSTRESHRPASSSVGKKLVSVKEKRPILKEKRPTLKENRPTSAGKRAKTPRMRPAKLGGRSLREGRKSATSCDQSSRASRDSRDGLGRKSQREGLEVERAVGYSPFRARGQEQDSSRVSWAGGYSSGEEFGDVGNMSVRSMGSVASGRSVRSVQSVPVGTSIRKSRMYRQFQRLKDLYKEKYEE